MVIKFNYLPQGVCGDSLYGEKLSLDQYHGHGFISDVAWNAANAACGNYSDSNFSLECVAALLAATSNLGDLDGEGSLFIAVSI